MAYLELIAGLILLVIAGDILVRGSVAFAQRLGVPTLLIGLTIVAFGTSAPELVVGVDAVIAGAPTLAFGNVVGSNIANILLVVGLPALIKPIACNAAHFGRNMTFMLSVSILVIIIASFGAINWVAGLLLVFILVTYLYLQAKHARTIEDIEEAAHALEDVNAIAKKELSVPKSITLIVLGLAGLIFGADLLVDGAVTVARSIGVSEAVIGLSLVAIGTSLPELVTGIAAAIRGHSDVAIGNVIGSNIFNILGIIGISSLFGDLPVPDTFLKVDFWVMIAASALLIPPYLMKRPITKPYGAGMFVLYILYMGYLATSGDGLIAGV